MDDEPESTIEADAQVDRGVPAGQGGGRSGVAVDSPGVQSRSEHDAYGAVMAEGLRSSDKVPASETGGE